MRRVVITGMGAASALGLELKEIEDALRQGKSGISFCPDFAETWLQLPGRWLAARLGCQTISAPSNR